MHECSHIHSAEGGPQIPRYKVRKLTFRGQRDIRILPHVFKTHAESEFTKMIQLVVPSGGTLEPEMINA